MVVAHCLVGIVKEEFEDTKGVIRIRDLHCLSFLFIILISTPLVLELINNVLINLLFGNNQ
jgi:hypothetical protein